MWSRLYSSGASKELSLNFLTYQLNSSTSFLRSLVLQIVGRFHQRSLYLQMLGERSIAKNCCPVSLLSVLSKVFKKLVNFDYLEKFDFFSDFHYGFSSSWSNADLPQLYLIELLGLWIGQRLLEEWNLIYPRLLTGFGMLVVFTNLRILGQIFGFISFLSNKWLRAVLGGKCSQEYPVKTGVPQSSILGLHFSYYTVMTFLTMLSVILLSMLMILLSVLNVIRHLICGKNLNWLLNLNLIYETLWTWVRNGLLISMLGKLSWFRLTCQITMVLLMLKWVGLFLRKNHILRCWGWPSLLNWIRALTSLFLKLASRKLELSFVLWSFFLLRLLYISINLPCVHVWNTVVASGLVPLVGTWNC